MLKLLEELKLKKVEMLREEIGLNIEEIVDLLGEGDNDENLFNKA